MSPTIKTAAPSSPPARDASPAVDHGPSRPDQEPSSADARAWRVAFASRRGGEPARSRHRSTDTAGTIALAIVVPCYNEEEVLPTTIERLADVRERLVAEGLIREESTVHFVDDGSRDATWEIVEEAAAVLPWVHGIKLSRNRGHQNALLAGLLTVKGDAVVSIDADLQDDVAAIREMVLRHREGAEIVYGVRNVRRSDTWFKRFTAESYYRLLHLFGVDVVFNHSDYRLISRAALEALQGFGEVNLFLRGLVPQLGFPTARVHYERAERFAGESKYPLKKMLAFAWDGITSFSSIPLRWITAFGFLVSLVSFATGCWAIGVHLFIGGVPGWASTVVPIAFLGGIQLLSLGVIGEYVGKTYVETKRRPRFVIEKTI